MVASNSSGIQLERNLQRFFIVLTSAACEWFLLFWLFVEAILSFFLKKFASYCKLQIPCIFCSRLDHILGKESPGFYHGLLCNTHKSELSSLLSCGSYGKLVPSHGICDKCLLSSARTSMPNHMHKSRCMHHGEKMRHKFSRSVSPNHLKKFGFDPLSHMGYSELKISSDSESDFPVSDDDEGKNIIQEKKVPKCDPSSHARCDDPNDMKSAFTGHKNDASEKKQGEDKKSRPSSIPELISLDDFPAVCNATEDSNGLSVKTCDLKFPISQDLNSSAALSELMSLIHAPPSIKFTEVGLRKSNVLKTSDSKSTEANVQEKNLKSVILDNDNLHDSYEFIEEKLDLKGSDNIEEAKMIPSGNSSQGILSDSEPFSQECESKAIEDSFSNGAENALVMNKIGSDSALSLSVDESLINEIEDESTINQLKRHIKQCKTKISALYVELEEERSASAVAANQAMAMITRLQEEKALLHMEALQLLRMMEEQAEHDVEALEKANDLLAEREKEIQDLEAELEIFRIKYLEEVAPDLIQEKSLDLHGNSKLEMGSGICEKDYVKASNSFMFRKASDFNEENFGSRSALMEFGKEKLFISQCLRDLERKLVENGRQQEDENVKKKEEVNTLNGNNSSSEHEKIDMVTLSNEISDMNERLEALETDWNFLEHTLNSLEAGKEGVHFVREISYHLQELRKNCMT